MSTTTANIEHLHNDVFGASFALYGREEIERFIEPFEIRFNRNNIDSKALFAGKKCLDAGCGNGRGSLFMASNGAREIHSLDISPLNIASTQRNAELFSVSNIIKPKVSSLEKIPFEDETFDFVWCNGVVMHTHNPDACVKELSRVLKKGGKAWIYVYGAGGIYWYCVYKFREYLKMYTEKECMDGLTFLQTPTPFLAEYMDDWKAPYLRTYSNQDFSSRLAELGFENTNPLPFGTDYDTSHRVNLYPNDRIFLGEGDLRYLVTKQTDPLGDEGVISASERGSLYEYRSEFTNLIDTEFKELEGKFQRSLFLKLLTFSYLQRNLRDQIFSSNQEFDLNNFLKYIHEASDYLDSNMR